MTQILKGKCAVITGATEGIGFETARLFLEQGARIAICGRRKDRLEQAKEELQSLADDPADVYGGVCDAADTKQLDSFLSDAAASLGGIDILINNAGIAPPALKLEETPDELWDQVMTVNARSVFAGIRAGAALMKEKGGVIINASSFAAVIPSVRNGVYAASKAAVTSLTRTAASELAPYGIRVVGYIPGIIDTRMNKESIQQNGSALRSPISLQRFGTPRDMAQGILFLASDSASYITGTCLEISGGKFATQNPQAAWDL